MKTSQRRLAGFALLGLTAFSLSACGYGSHDEAGTLTRHLTMIGEDGKRYGSVDMDPIGGGKVFDASGALIATLNPAAYSQQAATVAPTPNYAYAVPQ